MRPRDLLRYCLDLGWSDPLAVEAVKPPSEATQPSISQCATLDALAELAEGCRRCRLAEKRQTVVFGEGSPRSRVLFIGEAPGAEEDRSGRPFVGQAGQLLDAMIFAMGFEREDVYIANVLKCLPPGNRDPDEQEMAACAPLLDRQIELLGPVVIVALGRAAAQRLTGTTKAVRALRGRWTSYRGVPLLPTFHPAYLLRQPLEKRAVWEDLKKVLEKLSPAG